MFSGLIGLLVASLLPLTCVVNSPSVPTVDDRSDILVNNGDGTYTDYVYGYAEGVSSFNSTVLEFFETNLDFYYGNEVYSINASLSDTGFIVVTYSTSEDDISLLGYEDYLDDSLPLCVLTSNNVTTVNLDYCLFTSFDGGYKWYFAYLDFNRDSICMFNTVNATNGDFVYSTAQPVTPQLEYKPADDVIDLSDSMLISYGSTLTFVYGDLRHSYDLSNVINASTCHVLSVDINLSTYAFDVYARADYPPVYVNFNFVSAYYSGVVNLESCLAQYVSSTTAAYCFYILDDHVNVNTLYYTNVVTNGTDFSYDPFVIAADDPMDAISGGLGVVGHLGTALANGFDAVAWDSTNSTLTAVMGFAFILLGIGVSVACLKRIFSWIVGRHGM